MKRGFACGVFDLFHAGHVLMLEECRSKCDYLIVAINKADNISKDINPLKLPPLYSLEERVLIVKACRYVDEVLVYNSEDELLSLLENKNIQIRFLGTDYKGKPITGENLPLEIYYINRDHGLSTSDYKKKLISRSE